MAFTTCSNGHQYDSSISKECPQCASLRGKTMPLTAADTGWSSDTDWDDYGKTEPMDGGSATGMYGTQGVNMGGAADTGKTMPLDTQPVNPGGGNNWADTKDYRDTNFDPDMDTPTMPLNFDKGENIRAVPPVAGWLVCIEGASKGTDYRIHSEYNYIGRSTSMDICIKGDPTISRENHAIIAYDPIDRLFYFAPSGGGSIVRLNGRAVLGSYGGE